MSSAKMKIIIRFSCRLDDQIWGSDEEEEPNEEELNEDENGKGTNEDNDAHNDLDAGKNDDESTRR